MFGLFLEQEVWKLLKLSVALGAIYSLFINTVNSVLPSPVASSFIGIGGRIPDTFTNTILLCIIVGTFTYIVLTYVCEEKWVQEPISIKDCGWEWTWKIWKWVLSFICTLVVIFSWVLKLICYWKDQLVIGLTIICIGVAIFTLLA